MRNIGRTASDVLQPGGYRWASKKYPWATTKNPTWEAFEEELKRTFAIEDSSKTTRRGFEDWVETPDKGLKVVDVFSAFETRFGRLSARDQAILVPDKVIMFLQAVDVRDRKDL